MNPDDPANHLPKSPRRIAQRKRRPPLQFGLRSLLGITVAVSLLFGTLRWLDVSPRASAMVLLIVVVSVIAALGLVVAIAQWTGDE